MKILSAVVEFYADRQADRETETIELRLTFTHLLRQRQKTKHRGKLGFTI